MMLLPDSFRAPRKALRALFDYLTLPPQHLTDPQERRQVRAMAVLLISLTVLAIVFGIDWLNSADYSPLAPLIIFSSIGMFGGLYFVNRRGNYRFAVWTIVVFTFVASYWLVIDRPVDALALTYQLIAIVIVGVFMSVRTTAIVSLVVIIGTTLLPVLVDLPLTYEQYAPNAQAIVLLVALTMLSTWHNAELNKLRREEVAQSEKRYRIISELLSDFACAFDATYDDPPVEWVTDAVLPTTGYTPAELKRVSDWDRMAHPEDLPKLHHQRRSMYAGHPEMPVQFRITHKDGHLVWLSCTLHPEWVNGRVKTVYVAFTDITSYMHLKDEISEKELLRAQLAKEQEMSETRNKFMSIMSHEFRTPLAVILSTTEILDKYHERLNEDRRHELLERIISQVTQLAATMEDLSLLVQMQSGKLQFRPVPTDLAALTQRWVSDIRGSVGSNHQFDFAIEGDLSNIYVDERLLSIVVNNLLSNAVKYSQAGTTITVRLCREADLVTLKIADEGIGIPEADIQKLYQPYFRASNVGTVVGTGLGLRTVKECIELHDGSVKIESKVDAGTTLTITFPARGAID